MATTVFPNINVTTFALIGAAVLAAGLIGLTVLSPRSYRETKAAGIVEEALKLPREQWTRRPLTLLARPEMSTGRRVAMLTMSGYVVVAVILLVVKAVQLAGG
jgi:uncharacterized membrane protein